MHSAPRRFSFLLVITSAVLTLARSAGASDTDWHKITTPHFELYTDLDAQTAVEAAKELETTRDALITAAWPSFTFPEIVRTQVFVLSNGLDFERAIGRRTWGLSVTGTRPAFFLYGPPSRWAPRATLNQVAPSSVLRHEMTHQLAAAVFGRAPRWFSEGLAQFLETVQITANGQSIIVGGTNRDARTKFYADRTVTLSRMLEWDESIEELPENEVHTLYGTSWAFFYWLYNNQQEAFSRYQLALAKGAHAKEAWEAAFPGFNPDAHDPVLYEYLKHGKGAVDTLPLRTTVPSISVASMSPADAHAARARIAFAGASIGKGEPDKARLSDANAELKKALDLDPTNVSALLLAASMPSNDLLDAVRAAVKANPDDSRIHGLLGDLLNDRAEREAAYRRALQIDHDDPQVLASLARLLLESHRAEEAFPFALQASKRAPHDFNVLETFAAALSLRGRCQEAIQQQQRAVDRSRESATHAAAVAQRLKVMKASCVSSSKLSGSAETGSSAAAIEAPPEADSGATKPESTPSIRRHTEGIFTSATVGLGYGYGSYESTVLTTRGGNSFEGLGVDIAGAVGYGIAPGLVLALELAIFSHPAFSEQITYTTGAFVTDITTVRIGPLADIHLLANSPFHLLAGFDFVRGSWNGAYGVPPAAPLPLDEVSLGYLAHAAAGYVWQVHSYEVGVSLRFHVGALGSEHASGSLRGMTGLVGFYL